MPGLNLRQSNRSDVEKWPSAPTYSQTRAAARKREAIASPHIEEGLTIGVQIVGRRWSEMHLLGVCRTLESAQALPGFRPPPDLGAAPIRTIAES
jgi:Asp-tRNA(Asn)/Glu-tRNA(Gln) amidotransferase A subunit family amidase